MEKNNIKRRSFLKTAGLAAAGSLAFPYIIPSGRLFAATGTQLAKHVVLVCFAGGVRQNESVMQQYLSESQGLTGATGNIMYNMFNDGGNRPTQKRVYGTTPQGGLEGEQEIPQLLAQTIESQGLTVKEMYSRVVGHYSGLNALMTGTYDYTQGLKQKPTSATIFEYVRRHLGEKATKAWFVGNGINNSTPLLNYSEDPDYGVDYAANFLAPTVTFGNNGETHIKDFKVYHPEEELTPMYRMKYFLDSVALTEGRDIPGVKNTDEEKLDLKNFFKSVFAKKDAGTLAMPPTSDFGDQQTIGYACEVMAWFKPTITVVNLSNVDTCHSNYTRYLQALHRADHGVAHMWNYIQTQIPDMAGDTAMIIIPEHGRNLSPNPILDQNDFQAFDHSDAHARRVFGQAVGSGIPTNVQIGDPLGNPTDVKGNIIDGVLTAAELLGIKQDVISAGRIAYGGGDPQNLGMSMLDRI